MAAELILIVEDNEKNRKLERDILQFHGYQTIEADNAEEGIRLAQATPPALVLMDIQLPGMNGIEALQYLRADPRTRTIPVIAVTASVMTQDRQKIMAAGFDGYQAKPIEVTRFVAAVRTAVGRPQRGILREVDASPPPDADGSGDRVIDRRAFLGTLAGGLLAAPLAAAAQTAARVYRLGFLGQTSARELARQTAALRQGLRDRGYEEGRNLVIEYRWAERKLDRLPALATELVGAKVDIIVTHGSPGSRAAKQATAEIPIVIAVVGDPVANGVVASLARPGGNVTGLVLQEFESTVKWFELVKEVAPTASRLGWLDVPGIEQPEVAEASRRQEDAAALPRGLSIDRVLVRGPNDLTQAFDDLGRHGVHAVVVPNTSLLNPLGGQIASLAVKHRLPTIGSPVFARAGGLLAYGPDGADMYRRAADYVDRILKGSAPGDLPMEGPTKFELVINLKTAKALGLTIPPSLLQRADQVIE